MNNSVFMGSSILQSSPSFYITENLSFEEQDPWHTIDAKQPKLHTTVTNLPTEEITASNVLADVDLPEIYKTAYLHAGPVGDRITVEALEIILGLGGLEPRVYKQISLFTVPLGATYITRYEFYTALALLACAQHQIEMTLSKVYQLRNDLPIPSLPNLSHVSIKPVNPLMVSSTETAEDPWRPAHQKGEQDNMTQHRKLQNSNSIQTLHENSTLHTSDYDTETTTTTTIVTTTIPSQMVAIDIVTDKAATQALVKASTETHQWFIDVDQIIVSETERKGFLFTHMNYKVYSTQRQVSVRRRYSDFYWLWETLMKRYSFRIIPTIPPKKLSKKDKAFMENRLEGLSRFINCLVRHPVIKYDKIVVTFLTEPSELSIWRKSTHMDTNDEFNRVKPMTEELESFIPKNLETCLLLAKKRLPKTIEKYETLCLTMEGMINLKLKKIKYLKTYDKTLKDLREIEHDCFYSDCQECGQVAFGYDNVGTYMNQESLILESDIDSTKIILENLKRHNEICRTFLDLLDRKSKLEANQTSMLYRKIAANTARINQNRGVPGMESEIDRLNHLIQTDTRKMIYQQRRDIYIQYCMASELTYLHKQQAIVSLLYQDYTNDRLKYTRRTMTNYKALDTLLHSLPKPEQFI